jgi:TPR repeat protein
MVRSTMTGLVAVMMVLVGTYFSNSHATPSTDECDRLAANMTDPTRPAEVAPVDFEKIDPNQAIPACQQAVADQPNNARMTYQLGRALERAGKETVAIEMFEKAARNGHVKAMAALGRLYWKKKDAVESIAWFRRAADAGFSEGLVQLGKAYAEGFGVAEDKQEAVRLWRRSAEYGHPSGMISLAIAYLRGTGVPKDEEEGVRWFRKAADGGSVEAMRGLGIAYWDGTGVPKDKEEAVRWFRKAADGGSEDAMRALGFAYRDGTGVPKDEEEAVRWFRKAADGGSVRAMMGLGFAYWDGTGLPKDEEEAVRWFRKAADGGSVEAMLNLEIAYRNGQGVPKSPEDGFRWLQKAAERGNTTAMLRLATAYARGSGVKKNDTESVRWLRKSADAGDLAGINNLGVAYVKGDFDLAKNETEAVRWWRKGAEAGDASSMNNLGVSLQYGQGVPKDETEAFVWFRKAAEAGDIHGMTNLGVAYSKGLGTDMDDQQGIYWLRAAAEKGDEISKFFLWKLRPAIPRSLPNTEEFMGIISTCGTSNKISIDGNIRGSIKTFYDSLRAEGKVSLTQSSELLSLFPENQRSGVYQTYISCVIALVNKYQGAIAESDVKLIRETENGLDSYKLALGAEAASRLDHFKFDELISKAYYVTFSVACTRPSRGNRTVRGPFVFKYAADVFSDLYNAALIPRAYSPDLEREAEYAEETTEEQRKMRSEIFSAIRDKNIILSVRLVDDMRSKHKELSEDIDIAFGKGNCSLSDMKTDLFFLITTIGKDGFDDKHYFKLSGVVTEILNNIPQITATFDRSNEAEFSRAKNTKVSFRYERLELETWGDGTKLLFGYGEIENGWSMRRYDPKYVQPAVKFLRAVKASWK